MKKCNKCCNYYRQGCFGSYVASMCKVYGSLDCDQKERHPDTTAETCPMYNIEFVKVKEKTNIDLTHIEPFIDF